VTQPRGSRPNRVRVPVQGANFMPKRQRKQVRKSMVRAYLSNRLAEAQVARQDRMAFYRGLRQMKMMRRQIAKEMHALASMVDSLRREVGHCEPRTMKTGSEAEIALQKQTERLVDDASDCLKTAAAATGAAADEFAVFSRARIYYTEVI
jgi:hypothetical protein